MSSTSTILLNPANDAELALPDIWKAFMANPDIAIGVFSVDDDGEFRIVEVNAAARRFMKNPGENPVGRTLREGAIEQMGDFATERLRQCTETGEPQSYERSVQLAEGRVSWTTNLLPVIDRNGRVNSIVGMARIIPLHMDSTGIEERNRILVEGFSATAPSVIYLYDPHTQRANFVGGQTETLLGYRSHEIEEMDNPLLKLVHPDDLPWVAEQIGNVVSKPCDNVSIFQCRVQQKDGDYRLLNCHNRVLDKCPDGTARTLIGVANDVTDQEQLKQEVEALTDRLSTAQMEERRLIAQELHDSAGQYIVAAELALIGAQESSPELARDRKVGRALGEVMECLKDAEREIRVLSYLLHPPAIASQGLATVLRNFAEGFGGRAGVTVDVAIDRKVNAAPNRLAIPLLRICQEALTNIHRHAKASAVTVKLDVTDSDVELSITDDGIGIGTVSRRDYVAGVGLTAMRERVTRLGGTLDVANGKGTTLIARLPRR